MCLSFDTAPFRFIDTNSIIRKYLIYYNENQA